MAVIRKQKSGEYRLYYYKRASSNSERRLLGTFQTLEEATRHHQRLVQMHFFKR